MKTKFLIYFSLLMGIILTRTIISQGPSQNTQEECYQQALDQSDEIDLIIELLAEAASKGKVNPENKDNFLRRLQNMRSIIHSIKDTTALPTLIGTNEIMVSSLRHMTNNNFKSAPNITSGIITKRSAQPLTLNDAQIKLQNNENMLSVIQQQFKLIGLSTFNIIVREAEKITKKLKLHKIAPRLAPYALIFLYIKCIAKPGLVKIIGSYIPWPFKFLTQNAETPSQIKNTTTTINISNNAITTDTPKNTSSTSAPSNLEVLNDLFKNEGVVNIQFEPLIKLAPAAFLLGLVKNDPEDLAKAIKNKVSKLFSRFKNEKITKQDLFIKPTFSPESLDLMDNTEFRTIKNYFKYKNLFKLADHAIDKSYLLIGQQATNAYIADIFCAQLAKELKKDCAITHLNASDFVPPRRLTKNKLDKEDKLKKVLKDAKKHDICIVVIQSIDWIYEQKERTIAKLEAFLEQAMAESNIIVIALTDSYTETHPISKVELREISLENLTPEKRLQFIKAQLRCDHANLNLDLPAFARMTEQCTLADLKKMIMDAYTLAYATHKPLNRNHLLESAKKFMTKKRA